MVNNNKYLTDLWSYISQLNNVRVLQCLRIVFNISTHYLASWNMRRYEFSGHVRTTLFSGYYEKLVSYTSKDSDLFSSEFQLSWNRLKCNDLDCVVCVFLLLYDVIIFLNITIYLLRNCKADRSGRAA
jgi:hypothetical protein